MTKSLLEAAEKAATELEPPERSSKPSGVDNQKVQLVIAELNKQLKKELPIDV